MSNQKYRTIRIYPDDQQGFKRLSYRTGKPIVRLVSEALKLLEEKHKREISESKRYKLD